MLVHALVQRLFCFPNIKLLALRILALDRINDIALLMPGGFVFWMHKSLSQSITRFERGRDLMFAENSFQFL